VLFITSDNRIMTT